MASQQAGMQAGPSQDVSLDHNIVVEEVKQERYLEDIRTLVNKGDWASVLRILCQDRDNIRSSVAQLLQPMNSDEDTIVHLAASDGMTEVVRELLLLIKEDNQELWREMQANIHGNNPLHLAAVKDHEDTCKCLAEMALELVTATNADGNTPLHVAALKGHADICKRLAEMARETAKARNADGETPIFVAALSRYESVFNDLTSMFLDDPEIALARGKDGDTILHCAILGEYFGLISSNFLSKGKEQRYKSNDLLDQIVNFVVGNDFPTITHLASAIIDKRKELIYYRNDKGLTPLHLLANIPSAFKSACQFGLSDHIFYLSEKVSTESKLDHLKHRRQEDWTSKLPGYSSVKRTLVGFGYLLLICLMLISAIFGFAWWKWIEKINEIREKKHKHKWAKKVMKQLVHNIDHWSEFGKNNTGMDPYKYHLEWRRGINPTMRQVEEICSSASQQEIEIVSEPDKNFINKCQVIQPQQDPRMRSSMHSSTTSTSPNQVKEVNKRGIIESPFLIAGKKGVIEMVRAILKKFPMAIHDMDLEDKNIMQLAAEHRQHEIFDFMLDKESENLLRKVDAEGNSVLHLAAKYPQEQPVLIPGAASQMYYEYSWFRFVKETIPSHLSNRINHKGETAMEVFINTHQELAMERAKWLRNASQSCSVVAALITTVAFATISTVPGGLQQEKGSPVFQGKASFNTFSISSFIAFCFSALSLIMFLGILFFPNHDLDFGNNRPSNLIWGINSLFVSIVAMFLSFFSGDLFVLDEKMKYLAYPTFGLTLCVAISRSPFYSEFTRQAAFYSEFPDSIVGHIPKRVYPNSLSF